MKTGTPIPSTNYATATCVARRIAAHTALPFDPLRTDRRRGGDLLGRLAQRGARFIWCDEGVVHGPVEASPCRCAGSRCGRCAADGTICTSHANSGSFGALTTAGRFRLFARALAQAMLAALLSLVSWPLGRHRAAHWLLKASANLGKLTVFVGWHYREYGPEREFGPEAT
jgi:succinoglycan biosynthesis protein ExoM